MQWGKLSSLGQRPLTPSNLRGGAKMQWGKHSSLGQRPLTPSNLGAAEKVRFQKSRYTHFNIGVRP